jgi:hypothetical protein
LRKVERQRFFRRRKRKISDFQIKHEKDKAKRIKEKKKRTTNNTLDGCEMMI